MFYPEELPTALASMPALLELELHGIGCMADPLETLERELSLAPLPAFTRLTSLTLAGDEHAVCSKPGPALYLWLGWVLPAATQLRRLCLSCDFSYAGDSPASVDALNSTTKVTPSPHWATARLLSTALDGYASQPRCVWV